MNWRFDWIDGGEVNLSDELRSSWDNAFESHGNIWQCRQFFRCWDDTMAVARGQSPVLLIASDRAGHQVIYPLYTQRRSMCGVPFTVIEPMGGSINCDYQDPLSIGDPMREADRQSFWAALQKAVPKRFGRLSELRIYRLTDSLELGRIFKNSTIAPFIPLDGFADLQSFLAQRGRNHRQRVGRLLRRLQDRGGYVRHVASGSVPEAIAEFCRCYAEQWGREGLPHALQNPETRSYWLALASAATQMNKLHFTALEVGEKPWHWHLGLEHRGVLLWYKMTYDIRCSQSSPGMLHLALLIEEGIIAGGLRCIDLGYGAEEYKFKWTDHSQRLVGGRVGRLVHLTSAARRALSRGRDLRHSLSKR